MKTTQAIILVTLATLLLLPGLGAFTSANAKTPTLPRTAVFVDNWGNVYKLTFSATPSPTTVAINGQLMKSSYLHYTPWTVTGTVTHGNNFALTSKDPNTSDTKYCSFAFQGTFSSSGASGTWKNAGCTFESGDFGLNLCTSKVCIPPTPVTTSRPGV